MLPKNVLVVSKKWYVQVVSKKAALKFFFYDSKRSYKYDSEYR